MSKLRWLRPIFALSVLIFFLMHLPAVISGVQNGAMICIGTVLPALFFFAVAADLILSLTSGRLPFLSPKVSIFLFGALCGFPIGAIVCERMRHDGIVSDRTAAHLLPFVNNASPAFLLGAVSKLYGDARIGMLLLISQLAAAAILCLLCRGENPENRSTRETVSATTAFFDAVDHSVHSMLRITALICLFSALLAVLRDTVPSEPLFVTLALLFEIGNGTASAAALRQISPLAAVTLCGFVCGWSGICVHMQVLSVAQSIKIKYSHFLLCKAAEGVLCAFFTFCLSKIILGY